MNIAIMAEQLWFAIRVAPQKEFVAKKILGDNGLKVFLPTEHRVARANRMSKRKETYERPLLIGYLFVGFQGPPEWHLLTRFRKHVFQYIVGVQGAPVQISSEVIDYLRKVSSKSEADAMNPKRRSHWKFSEGDEAQLPIGPFDHLRVLIERITGKKAQVRLHMFGTTQSVVVSLDRLEVL